MPSLKVNHMICPRCGHDFYVSASYATCDACGTFFYASDSATKKRNGPSTTMGYPTYWVDDTRGTR